MARERVPATASRARQSATKRMSLSSRLNECRAAEPSPSKPRRCRARHSSTIECSTDTDTSSDMNDSSTTDYTVNTQGRELLDSRARVLKEIAVPMVKPKDRQRYRRSSPSTSPGSSALSDLATMSDYDTPGTSAAVTPAESIAVSRKIRQPTINAVKTSGHGLVSVSANTNLQDSKGKRKRNADDDMKDQMIDDELLAEALQEQEYDALKTPHKRPLKSRVSKVLDSEDDFDESEEMSSQLKPEPASRPNTTELHHEKVKRVKRDGGMSLPKRAARESARKSITEKMSLGDTDDDEDEDSQLSAFSSGLGSEIDDSDLDTEDDLTQSNDVIAEASAAAAQVIHPTTRRRNRVRGNLSRSEATRQSMLRRGASRNTPWLNSRAAKERRKLEKAHPEILTLWDNLRAVPTIVPERAKQPETITRQLKSFQLEGLDWMCKQERSQWKGGLLGDEMGMGKTIQAVSLIMSDYPAKSPSLVVVPPVALMQWQNEINEYTNGKLKVLVHHNTDPKVKKLTMKELKGYDIVMISYAGLESIYRKESKGWKRDDGLVKENSRIHAIHFHRLILDEAHSIKSRTTSVAKACFALKADYKWCLSGTPVQNRIGEFFSLLRFLEVKPFACYFCKYCRCAELHWSQNEAKKCMHCNHSGFSHVSIFNKELLSPLTQGEDDDLRREALGKLRLLTDRIMLRRMKRDYTAAMELPPKEVILHQEFFGEIERDFSSSIMTNTNRTFDTYVSRGVMLNNYANIFGLIMQMRQVANHPDLILKKHAEGGQNCLVCSICDEPAEEPIRSRCRHEFCRKCAKDYVRSFEGTGSGEPDCPRCHISLAIDFDQPDIEQDEEYVRKSSIINRIKMEDWTSSTKIEMLVYDLYKLRSKKQTMKSIVFSQFTSMLQLVEWRLRRAGFNTVMLDGSMSPVQRQRSIEYFMNNTDVEVFLVSLKAGGVALNLTEASRVFIVDPWWNPAAEWQSADRCHRIGQKRPCVITRLCIEDSVESRMVMLQEKKANMINGTINNDQVAIEKLTPADMQFLFRGS